MKKIAWFTPFTKKSAIANISKQVTDELQKYYNIEIFTDSVDDLFETKLKVNRFVSADRLKLSGYDYLIYQIGNFSGYHRGCYEAFKKFGGIVVQHDQTMIDFFYSYFLDAEYCNDLTKGHVLLSSMIKLYYGESGVIFFKEALQGKCNIRELDMLMEIFVYATGVFTHSNHFMEKISSMTNVHSAYSVLPLQEDYTNIPVHKKDMIFDYFVKDKSKILIVASGIVHPVKRIDKVVDVILSNDTIKKNVQFVVLGDYCGDYGDKLYNLSQNKLKNILFMLGYQNNDVMKSAICNADICVNLRYPNTEVCSLSVLEQMAFGKPCIVLNSGFFGELPDDAVLKTTLENEASDVLTFLTKAIQDRRCYREIGERAKQFVQNECDVKKYVERFNSFLEKIDSGIEKANAENALIDSYKNILTKLSFTEELLPTTLHQITNNIYSVFADNISTNNSKSIVL